MLRPLLRASAACAFAALLVPAAPSAAPPSGVAYDEIVRIVVNETPPPPGAFAADLAAVRSATPSPLAQATPAPRRRGLGSLTSIAGAVLSGNPNAIGGAVAQEAIGAAVENAIQRSLSAQFGALAATLGSFLQPHVMHYAYWNGWERVDDTTAQTATIRKCDLGQVITLDLARKTYSVYTPGAEPVETPHPMPRGRTEPANPAEPGTANASFTLTTTSLGTRTFENRPAAGYTTTATFAMTNATGSCRNGSGSIETTEYLPALARPTVAQCPLRRVVMTLPETPVEAVAPPSGGCRPTFSAQKSGPVPPSNRLSLYTLMRVTGSGSGAAPAPQASGAPSFAFLTERGNLRGLGPADAGLFAIPQGFTKTP